MNDVPATNPPALSREALQARIDAIPRVPLAHRPTPLEHCPRLAAAIGGPDLYVKRDDLTGLAFGGNKTRHLEFLFADILVLLEPMGVGLEDAEGGPRIQRPVRTGRDVDALRDPAPEESLAYVYAAVRSTRAALEKL